MCRAAPSAPGGSKRTPLITAVVVCVLATAHTRASGYPAHEIWGGGGKAASFENSIFNVPNDVESSPDAPYVLAGFSWIDGTVKSSATGELSFGGVSGCVGAGAGIALGRRFMLSVEGLGSFGTAEWKQPPFSNSSGKKINPSIVAVYASIGFRWGNRE